METRLYTIRYFGCAEYLRHRGFTLDGELVFRLRKIPVRVIQEAVARHFKIPVAEMRSARRGVEVARPRQVAMFLAKQLTSQSLSDIGRRFQRDHTTVMHAIKRIGELRSTDETVADSIEALTTELRG